jgi:hypothetical protein
LLKLKRLCAEAFLSADFSHPRAVSINPSSWRDCDFAQVGFILLATSPKNGFATSKRTKGQPTV